jgi:hypothetical protein
MFTRNELLMIADISNPGSIGAHAGHAHCGWSEAQAGEFASDAWLAIETRANIEDSFQLYPGVYEEKWGIHRDAMLRKLADTPTAQLAKIARAVARFWDDCHAADAEAKLIEAANEAA